VGGTPWEEKLVSTKTLTGDYLVTYNLTSPVTRLTIASSAYLLEGVTAAGAGTYTLANYGQLRADELAVSLTGSGVITNAGTIAAASSVSGGGIILGGGGSVTNAAHALIRGYDGVSFASQMGTVVNDGSIVGTAKYGVALAAGGMITNGGTANTAAVIRGPIGVVAALPATLRNFGTVAGSGTYSVGAYLKAGGLIVNGAASDTVASITGANLAVGAAGISGTVVNYGSLRASSAGAGVLLANGGTVTNGSATDTSALIEGGAGILGQGGSATIKNFGSIRGDGATLGGIGIGVYLADGGVVTNGTKLDTTASITGLVGIGGGTIGAVTIDNFGTIGDDASQLGVLLGAGGEVTNGSVSDTTALIEGYVGLGGGGPITVINFGSIEGTGSATIVPGIYLVAGGRVVNGSTADTIALVEGLQAVYAKTDAATVINFGRLQGDVDGVALVAGGSLTNGASTASGAVIQGADAGVRIDGASGTVTNFGSIIAGQILGVGVYLGAAGGVVTNGASTDTHALIQGGVGVVLKSRASAINWGTIVGGAENPFVGVRLGYKCNLTNEAGALVVGYGGVFMGEYGALTNFGTVRGTGTIAVDAGYTNGLVKAEGGSAFIGTVLSTGAGFDAIGGVTSVSALVTYGAVFGAGTLSLNGAASKLSAGVSLTVAKIVVAGAATSVEVATTLSDAKVWSQTAGTLIVDTGDKLSFTGVGDSFAGTLTGAGEIAFTGGSDTLSNVTLSAATMVVNGPTVTLSGSVVLSKTLTVTSSHVVIAAAGATLTGGGTLSLTNHATNLIKGASAAATLTNFDRITGAGQLGGGSMTLVNKAGGIINANLATALIINTGTVSVTNAGVIESTSTGGLTISGAVANTGSLTVTAGTLDVTGAVTGTGVVRIGGGVAEFGAAFSENVTFSSTSGVLELSHSVAYAGKVTGFSKTGGTALDLLDIASASASASYSGTTASGVLTVTDGTHTARIHLIGDYTASTFTPSSDGHGGTSVVDPTAAAAGRTPPMAPLVAAMAAFAPRGAAHALFAPAPAPRQAYAALARPA
jgi:hypothetical protein